MGAVRSEFNAQTYFKLIPSAAVFLGLFVATSLPPVLIATMAVALYAALFAPDLFPKRKPAAAMA